ncbi:unnamed protein product [Malus baccata var. baccata]
MGDDNENSKKPTQLSMASKFDSLNHLLYLHHSDQRGLVLVSQLLTKDNYNTWSHSMIMALTVKNKYDFVDGSIKKPSEEDVDELQQWRRCNSLVKTWLLSSISKEIAARVFYCDGAQAVWNELRERFSQIATVELRRRNCSIEFLMGLTESFTMTRGQILMMDHLPKVSKAYSLVLKHERQRDMSTGKGVTQLDASVFAARDTQKDTGKKSNNSKCEKCDKTGHNTENCRSHLKCTYCGWKGHTVDYCRKLKKAESDQPKSNYKGNHVAAHQLEKKDLSNSFPFTQEQCQQILNMLGKNKTAMANHVVNSSTNDKLSGKMIGTGTEREGL